MVNSRRRMLELRSTLFQMGPLKAPRSDGFPAGFYHKFWNVVGEDVTRLCLDCLNGGRSVGMPYSLLCLILKVKNVERLSDIRPISLCNVIYKCVSKALANHL